MAIRNGDLVGTKNGTNVDFTFPTDVVPIPGSERIIWEGYTLYPVGAFGPNPTLECIISGQNVTMGSAPASTNKLHFSCDVA
jgi:hypothetical protein